MIAGYYRMHLSMPDGIPVHMTIAFAKKQTKGIGTETGRAQMIVTTCSFMYKA